MISIVINGIKKELNLNEERKFKDLLEYVRTHFVQDETVIKNVRVNGMDIGETEEQALQGVSIGQLQSIEIFTAHSKELAEETLQLLIDFSSYLKNLSIQTSALEQLDYKKLQLLFEGLQTFLESYHSIKKIYQLSQMQDLALLEADLTSILNDINTFQNQNRWDYVKNLLNEALPEHLEEWRSTALPKLIKLRSS